MKHRLTINYTVPIYESRPTSDGGGTYSTEVGKRQMIGEIEIDIDMNRLARTIGRKACENKTRRSKVGPLTIKCLNVYEQS